MEEVIAVFISYFIGASVIIILAVTSLIILLLIYEKISSRIKYGKPQSRMCKSIADLYDDAYDKDDIISYQKVPILDTKPRDLSLINIELIE